MIVVHPPTQSYLIMPSPLIRNSRSWIPERMSSFSRNEHFGSATRASSRTVIHDHVVPAASPAPAAPGPVPIAPWTPTPTNAPGHQRTPAPSYGTIQAPIETNFEVHPADASLSWMDFGRLMEQRAAEAFPTATPDDKLPAYDAARLPTYARATRYVDMYDDVALQANHTPCWGGTDSLPAQWYHSEPMIGIAGGRHLWMGSGDPRHFGPQPIVDWEDDNEISVVWPGIILVVITTVLCVGTYLLCL